jgi:hypothetical protein
VSGIRPGAVDSYLEPECEEERLVSPNEAPFPALIRALEEEHERAPRITEGAVRGALAFLKVLDVHLTDEEWRDHVEALRDRQRDI